MHRAVVALLVACREEEPDPDVSAFEPAVLEVVGEGGVPIPPEGEILFTVGPQGSYQAWLGALARVETREVALSVELRSPSGALLASSGQKPSYLALVDYGEDAEGWIAIRTHLEPLGEGEPRDPFEVCALDGEEVEATVEVSSLRVVGGKCVFGEPMSLSLPAILRLDLDCPSP